MCSDIQQAIISNIDRESGVHYLDLGLHYENVGRASCWLGRKVLLAYDEVWGWSFEEYSCFWLIIRFLFPCCFRGTHLKTICQRLSNTLGVTELKVQLHQLWIETYPNESSPFSREVESYRNLLTDGLNDRRGITETDLEEILQVLQSYPTTKKLFDDAKLAARQNFDEDLAFMILPSIESLGASAESFGSSAATDGSKLYFKPNLRKSELQALLVFELCNTKNFKKFIKVGRKVDEGVVTSAQNYAFEMEKKEFKTIKETLEIIETAREEGLEGWSASFVGDWKNMASDEETRWESALRDYPDHVDLYKKQFEKFNQFRNLQNEETPYQLQPVELSMAVEA
jgi:hypothetical protein